MDEQINYKNMIYLELKRNEGKYVSKENLMRLINKSERTVRNHIATLRDEGYLIVSNSGGAGYSLNDDEEEVDKYIEDMDKRAKKTFKRVQNAKEKRKRMNQEKLEI